MEVEWVWTAFCERHSIVAQIASYVKKLCHQPKPLSPKIPRWWLPKRARIFVTYLLFLEMAASLSFSLSAFSVWLILATVWQPNLIVGFRFHASLKPLVICAKKVVITSCVWYNFWLLHNSLLESKHQ